MPSAQVSAVGDPAATLHTVVVPSVEQIWLPLRRHAPTPTEHAAPTGKPSSVSVSQSSSTPLQVSVLVDVVSLHTAAPPLQVIVPSTQRSPSVPSHGVPTAKSSSVNVSQSSSIELQLSAVGVPGTALHTAPMPSQAIVPLV